jgi:iron transport multicopper oxidase
VALAFSCLTGIIGVCVIAWYGFSQPVEDVPKAVTSIIHEADVPETDNTQSGATGTDANRTTT